MNRVECPACQVAFPFARVNVKAPNTRNDTTEFIVVCPQCGAEFKTVIDWESVKTKHVDSWFRRVVQRKAPTGEYDFRLRVKTQLV